MRRAVRLLALAVAAAAVAWPPAQAQDVGPSGAESDGASVGGWRLGLGLVLPSCLGSHAALLWPHR